MILPIVAYGDPVLRKKATAITPDYPKLEDFIASLFETMYEAHGVGLAAPQVGQSIRIFVVDTEPFANDKALSSETQEFLANFKQVFINPEIEKEEGEEWAFTEGCLSIPDIQDDVWRKPTITLRYQDAQFKLHTRTFTGLAARVIQHEYDHLEGILFTDTLSPLKKRLLKSKLTKISKGDISVDYRMRFPQQSKRKR